MIDKCTKGNGTPPAPSVHISGIFGLNFDKSSPSNYYRNCDTYGKGTTLEIPQDCRWHDCHLPSSISSQKINTDMTVEIFFIR